MKFCVGDGFPDVPPDCLRQSGKTTSCGRVSGRQGIPLLREMPVGQRVCRLRRRAAPYDLLRITSAQLIKVRYDVYHTTEVYLRDTTVTFLNKLMKRVQKINYNLAYNSAL